MYSALARAAEYVAIGGLLNMPNARNGDKDRREWASLLYDSLRIFLQEYAKVAAASFASKDVTMLVVKTDRLIVVLMVLSWIAKFEHPLQPQIIWGALKTIVK
jgi:hypothetical protein